MTNAAITQMETVQQALNQYELEQGLPTIQSPSTADELNQYLNMNRNQLDKLPIEDCVIIAIRLKQFALYLQRLNNIEQSRLTWAAATANRYVAHNKLLSRLPSSTQYFKADMKLETIAASDNYLAKLLQIQTYAQQRCDRLTYLSACLKSLAATLIDLQRAKLTMQKES